MSKDNKVQNNTTAKNKLIDIIDCDGLCEIAERLSYLDNLPIDDPLDKPLMLKSLEGFATFVLSRESMPKTRLSVSPNGFLNAEWDVNEDSLAMEFLDENSIRFAVILYSELPRQHINGEISIDNMIKINKSLLERFGL